MSIDNNKDKKEEKIHPGDEDSQTAIAKKNEKEPVKNESKAEDDEIIEKLPQKAKEKIETFMSMGSISGSFLSPFESKINERHIDKILDMKEKYDDNAFKDAQQARKFHLIYILAGISIFIFLAIFLVGKDTELFKEIIKLFITFIGGMGAGFGVKHYLEK